MHHRRQRTTGRRPPGVCGLSLSTND
jgi:hypothetical protein